MEGTLVGCIVKKTGIALFVETDFDDYEKQNGTCIGVKTVQEWAKLNPSDVVDYVGSRVELVYRKGYQDKAEVSALRYLGNTINNEEEKK